MVSGSAIAARDSLDIKNSAITIDYASAGTLVVTFVTAKSYSVRWKGLLLPELDQIFTFTVGKRTPFQWENVTLYLDKATARHRAEFKLAPGSGPAQLRPVAVETQQLAVDGGMQSMR